MLQNKIRTFKLVIFILLPIAILFSCKQNVVQDMSYASTMQDSIDIATLFANRKLNKDSSEIYLSQAQALASKSIKNKAIFLGLLGKEMILLGQLDSANSIADKGLQLNYEPYSRGLKGKFYNIKGNVAGLKKQLYQSIDYYLQAEKIYESVADSAALAGINSNVANSYFSLKDYPSAHQYATKAYALLPSVKESNIASNIITTYALSLIKIGKNKDALPIVQKADSLAEASQNKMAKITATIGFAEVYKSEMLFDSAIVYYNKCIALSKELGVKHFELMSAMGLLSLYEEQGNSNKIIQLAEPTIALANQMQNVDVLHTAKRIAGRALGKNGQYQKGFKMLSESYALYDSVAGVENQKNINELLVKYDAEKNEKEILNQNLLLAKQETKLRNRQLIILGLVLGLSILLVVYFYVRKLNKERLIRLEIEKQKKIGDAYIYGEQKERTRLAFEIHDGIASMLTGISYKLRAADANKEEVLNLLTGLHEDTRRISHSLMPIDFEQKNLIEAVSNLCERMTNKEIEIIFFASKPIIGLDNQKSLLLYRVIQELINNALKYAQCKSIFVRIENKEQNLIEICVEDDGVGLSGSLIQNGLKSIKERIKSLGARLLIESEKEGGTAVKIYYNYG
jgi:signal transduction histidine kinase